MSHTITGIGLDSSHAHPLDSHLTVLAKGTTPLIGECWGGSNNTKTSVVDVDVVIVTIRGPTITRIVGPRPAAFSAYPTTQGRGRMNQMLKSTECFWSWEVKPFSWLPKLALLLAPDVF